MSNNVLQIGAARIPMRTDLDEFDAAHVPAWDEDYQIDTDLLELLAIAAEDDVPAMIVGPEGSGKTAAIRALAAICNQPVRRINFHADVRAADVLGEKALVVDPASGQAITDWTDGILPDAMRRGHWFLIDEIDTCPAGLAMVLQSVLEPGHVLTLAPNGGEVIVPAGTFRIWATANTLGRGDDAGLFAGTNILNTATLDRFDVIALGYPVAAREEAIVVAKSGIPADVARRMVEAANLIRAGYDKRETATRLSTRRLIAWARRTMRLLRGNSSGDWTRAQSRAARIAVLNKCGPEDARYIAAVLQRTCRLPGLV